MPKIVRCARCNAKLKYPVWINGKAYGSTCATYIQPTIDYLAEIKSLKNQVTNLTKEVQILKMNNGVTTTNINPPNGSHNEENPIGMNYGCGHQELMDELRSVLKERLCN